MDHWSRHHLENWELVLSKLAAKVRPQGEKDQQSSSVESRNKNPVAVDPSVAKENLAIASVKPTSETVNLSSISPSVSNEPYESKDSDSGADLTDIPNTDVLTTKERPELKRDNKRVNPPSESLVAPLNSPELLENSENVSASPDSIHQAKYDESSFSFFTKLPWNSHLPIKLPSEKHFVFESDDKFTTEEHHSPQSLESGGSGLEVESRTAAEFFSLLPWTDLRGSEQVASIESDGDLFIRVSADRKDSGLDIREEKFPSANLLNAGMRSAAITSDRIAEKQFREIEQPTASRFFSELPWR